MLRRDEPEPYLKNVLVHGRFSELTAGVRSVCGFRSDTNKYDTPSPAIKIGQSMKLYAEQVLATQMEKKEKSLQKHGSSSNCEPFNGQSRCRETPLEHYERQNGTGLIRCQWQYAPCRVQGSPPRRVSTKFKRVHARPKRPSPAMGGPVPNLEWSLSGLRGPHTEIERVDPPTSLGPAFRMGGGTCPCGHLPHERL